MRQAKAILQRLELEKGHQRPQVQQLDFFTPVQETSPLVKEIAELDLLNMTGRDALNLLYDLQEKAKDEMA